jgi:hypothetical protein
MTKQKLYFAPTGQYVEARIAELTRRMAERQIHFGWWNDQDLLDVFESDPIDRYWNWNDVTIEYNGKPLIAKQFAIITGDNAVQGAMMISAEPVHSILSRKAQALFVELLFTAPRNRPTLRRDGRPYFLGVGTQLLACGAALSREMGFNGRLLLDGSPEYLSWYKKRGLQILDVNPIVFEGVTYTPMELSASGANDLIENSI